MTQAAKSIPTMLQLARNTSQYIDGTLRQGEGASFPVLDPSTGQAFIEIAGASVTQVEEMITVAVHAQAGWGARSRAERVAMLRRYIECLASHVQELKQVLVQEGGCLGGSTPSAASIMQFQTLMPTQQVRDMLDLYLTLPEVVDNPLPLERRITPHG